MLLIVNEQAGGGRAAARMSALREELRRHGLRPDEAVTRGPGAAVKLARDAAAAHDCVVAVGGDGTVNEVASGLLAAAPTPASLGVVPFGTGNDVAQVLGISSVPAAAEVLARGRSRTLDAIEVRCHLDGVQVVRHALLFAAVGFAGELLRHTTARVKRWLGPRYCYSFGFFRALLTFQAPAMRVTCDGRQFSGKFFHVCVGNSEYAGGGVMRLSPGARPDDGRLNVSVVEALGRLEALRYFPRLRAGTHIGHPKLRYFEATAVTVETERPATVQIDGDQFGQTPARFAIKPGALKVVTALPGTGTAERA